MKRLSVVHVCNLPLPATHPDFGRLTTHPGRWVLNLALAQKAHAEIDPVLVVQIPEASADHETLVEGIKVCFVAAPNRLRSATFFHFDVRRLSGRIRKLAPDLVHAHGTEDAYALAAQATGIPNLITAQGCFFIINRQLRPKLISRASVVQFTESIALRRARDVIAKSVYVKDELQKAFPHLRIHEIPNTFDARLLDIDPAGRREPRSVAFVGTVEPRKGFDVLISSMALLPPELAADVRLHIFGNRQVEAGTFEAREIARARELLGERLTLHGTIPALEVAEKVACCWVLAAPSREEMFGNQVIEAMLVGTPVVVTDQTAMAENVRRFQGGEVVPQEDAKALAGAIGRLLGDSSRLAFTGARERVSGLMSPQAVASAHRRLYDEILAGR